MAESRRFSHASSRSGKPPGLVAALRREALAERPEFSPHLHARVRAAVADITRNHRRAEAVRRWRAIAMSGGCLVAMLVAAFGIMGSLGEPAAPFGSVTGGSAAPAAGIERLPTPTEIRDGLYAEVQTLAAAAVGIPEAWPTLAMLAVAEPAAP